MTNISLYIRALSQSLNFPQNLICSALYGLYVALCLLQKRYIRIAQTSIGVCCKVCGCVIFVGGILNRLVS